MVFPPTVMAYNLQEKTWRELFVDRITDIRWNKQAFTDLVVDPKTKELVQAVVMKQLDTAQSTDFVTGKGNGLIMLLHGAPGTGKTFTAEGVAEFAESHYCVLPVAMWGQKQRQSTSDFVLLSCSVKCGILVSTGDYLP